MFPFCCSTNSSYALNRHLQPQAEYVEKLEQVFHAMDDAGDGTLASE